MAITSLRDKPAYAAYRPQAPCHHCVWHCDKMPGKSNLEKERFSWLTVPGDTVYLGGEGGGGRELGEAGGDWSHGNHSQEAEADRCWHSACSLLLFSLRPLSQPNGATHM